MIKHDFHLPSPPTVPLVSTIVSFADEWPFAEQTIRMAYSVGWINLSGVISVSPGPIFLDESTPHLVELIDGSIAVAGDHALRCYLANSRQVAPSWLDDDDD